MKILQKGQTSDGTAIQREEWNEDYEFMEYGATVAAYPIAKESANGLFAPKRGEKFRAAFQFNTTEEAEQCFNQLASGEKTLIDYVDRLDRPDHVICL